MKYQENEKRDCDNTPEPPAESPLVLTHDVSERGQADSVIRLGWCLKKEVAKKLQEHNAQDVHVLVVVSHDGKEMSRYLCPIEQEYLFIPFKRPGLNTIHATIIRPNIEAGLDKEDLEEYILEKGDRGAYETPLLDYAGERIRELSGRSSRFRRHPGETQLPIEVPREMFAPDPGKFRKALVSFVFPSKRFNDQCHFRRNTLWSLLFALPLSLFILAKWVMMFALTVLAFFVGMRDISLRPLRHPRTLGPAQIGTGNETNRWAHKPDGTQRHPVWWAINPPVFTVVAGIYFLGTWVSLWIIYGAIAVVICIAGVALVGLILSMQNSEEKRKAQKEAQARKKKEREAAYQLQLGAMACDVSPEVREIILEKPITVRLRLSYAALKAKVCRPFPR